MSNSNLTVRDGISIKTTASSPAPAAQGDLNVNTSSGDLQYNNGSVTNKVATETNTLTLSNKSLDASANTFTNIANSAISATAAIAYSKLNLSNSIVNADINTSAAIVYSKLSLTNSIVDADIASAAAIAYSKLNLVGSIVNADISTSAAIARAKIAAGSINQVVINDGTGLLTSEAQLATSRGGTGQNLSASTGILHVSSGTVSASAVALASADVSGTLPIGNGGTGQITKSAAFDALSPNTTKGDFTVSTGSTNVRQPIGTDNQVLVADSTQTNGLKWTTLQQGAKNYITFNNFENNSTTGWSLGTVGALTNNLPTGTPTFGSGASGNLSISTVNSGQLAGSFSLSYASSAATTQGDMLATQAYTLDIEDQAKVLGYRFYYKAQTGSANCNFSGTSSNSFSVAVWDVTNSSFIPVVGAFNLVQGSGVGLATGNFQTNSNTGSLRFIVYNANATSGAATLYFDDFFVGPQVTLTAPAMGDWIAYTPTFTGFGTPTGISVFSKRNGDSLEIKGFFTAGTPTATQAQITLGYNGANANVSIDSSKIATNNVVGAASIATSSASFFHVSVLASNGGNFLLFGSQQSALNDATPANGNNVSVTGQVFSFFASVPIAGWSSNAVSSADSDTRVVAMRASVAPATASGVIVFSTVDFDTHAKYDNSTGKYTAPVSGFYQVQVSTTSSGATGYAAVYKNGTQEKIIAYSASTDSGWAGTALVKLNAGDFITIVLQSGLGIGADSNAWFGVSRLSGPAVVQATESVNCKVSLSSNTSVTANNPIKFDVSLWDTHNEYSISTGQYTAPVPGKYQVHGHIAANAYSGNPDLSLYVNGSAQELLTTFQTGGAGYWPYTTTVKLNAGDTVDVRPDATMTIGGHSGTAYVSVMSIVRVGN